MSQQQSTATPQKQQQLTTLSSKQQSPGELTTSPVKDPSPMQMLTSKNGWAESHQHGRIAVGEAALGNRFPTSKRQSNGPPTTTQQSFIPSQQLTDLGLLTQAQQRHQMDQDFAHAVTMQNVEGVNVNSSLRHIGSNPSMNSGMGQLPLQSQKRSGLEGNQLYEGSKFRLQHGKGQQANSNIYPQSTNMIFSNVLANEQQQNSIGNGNGNNTQQTTSTQFNRGFIGAGNQIAAGPPFKGSSTLSSIGSAQQTQVQQSPQQHSGQQPPQWINRISRQSHTNMNHAGGHQPHYSHIKDADEAQLMAFQHQQLLMMKQQQQSTQMNAKKLASNNKRNNSEKQNTYQQQSSSQKVANVIGDENQQQMHVQQKTQYMHTNNQQEPGANSGARIMMPSATNSAGRKTRIKSSRRRRFSSSSINQKNQEPQSSTTTNNRKHQLKIQGTKEGIGCAPTMTTAAAHILNVNNISDTKQTVTSTNMASMSAAYSSVGELNIRNQESVADRFNSRAQKKALNSVQTNSTHMKDQMYTNMQNIVDQGQTVLKQNKNGVNQQQQNSENMNGAHYGTHQSANSGQTTSGNTKKYSQSVTRRNNNNHALQETASGNNLDSGSQDQNSQHSNKNFNSLRNSKSLNKKMSATGNRKSKKLKKSESQVKHQQMAKSEMMTQYMRIPQDEVEIGSQQVIQQQMQPINRGSQQQSDQIKRVQNRTPQSFIGSEKMTSVGTQQANGSTSNPRDQRASNKQAEGVRGSSNTGANIQVPGSNNNNLTDLHKNAMHIKKLNFTGRQMHSHATQPVIANHSGNHHHFNTNGLMDSQNNKAVLVDQLQQQHLPQQQRRATTNSGLEPLQQLQMQMALQNQAKEGNNQNILSSSEQKNSHQQQANSERQQHFYTMNAAQQNPMAVGPGSTIESMIKQQSNTGQNSFQDFKNQFSATSGGAQSNSKTYKLLKSAERGETHNTVLCKQHQEKSSGIIQSKSPCTCSRGQNNAANGGGFQSKASQNFQKTFRQGNFVYHGGRRSNDFSTIQATKQSAQLSSAQSPFGGAAQSIAQTPVFTQPPQSAQQSNLTTTTPHITQQKREDVNKYGGNFNSAPQQSQAANPALNPLMKDLLQYLQTAYQNQQESIGGPAPTGSGTSSAPQSQAMSLASSEQLNKRIVVQNKQRTFTNEANEKIVAQKRSTAPITPTIAAPIIPQQSEIAAVSSNAIAQSAPRASPAGQAALVAPQQVTTTQQQQTPATGASSANAVNPFAAAQASSAASASQKNKLIHFEKGDRIIYEPNEMHQLKYINDKGEVSPITGVQYILTQPNFSKGRPCHFFVVNKQEFEAATKGFKLKQEEQQKAEDLAKQKKLQAVANIRSHRASQKLRTQGNSKGKKGLADRKASAKGSREAKELAAKKLQEEEKKDEKTKYHNEAYTYQKLRSLKWMGGAYKNPHDEAGPIWRPSAEEQELRQQLEAKREIKAKYNLLSLNKQEQTELYKYILLNGNNSEVVKRVMDTRPSWVNIKSSQTLYNFKWAPSSRQIKFDFLGKHGQKNLVNHFENHALITTKDQLVESMSKLCENLHQDIFSMMPVTFVIDLATPLCQHEFDKFCQYFNMVDKYKMPFQDAQDESTKDEVVQTMNRNIQQHHQLSEKKRKYTKMTMSSTLFQGHNTWLFKPNDANRGRGVNLFNSIEQLKSLILEHTSRAESKQFQNFAQANNLHGTQGASGTQAQSSIQPEDVQQITTQQSSGAQPTINPVNVKSDVFVLQKYIEKPLLISQRKFDIRLWVMVTAEHKCYLFKEGYIRMSGQKYDLSQQDNLLVHLTNNAIQKHATNYGQYEEGNILSFKEGADFLRQQDGLEVDFYQILKEDMLPIIESTMMSVRQKINKNNRKFCMEIFGYDFMIDSQMSPWLIEVNTNPCLEESNQLLRNLIPRMLDDAFKLTLDVMFPPMAPAKISEALGEEEPLQSSSKVFPVNGYTDTENLFGDQPFYILRVPGCVVVQGS